MRSRRGASGIIEFIAEVMTAFSFLLLIFTLLFDGVAHMIAYQAAVSAAEIAEGSGGGQQDPIDACMRILQRDSQILSPTCRQGTDPGGHYVVYVASGEIRLFAFASARLTLPVDMTGSFPLAVQS